MKRIDEREGGDDELRERWRALRDSVELERRM
jgi:hypothetical protein